MNRRRKIVSKGSVGREAMRVAGGDWSEAGHCLRSPVLIDGPEAKAFEGERCGILVRGVIPAAYHFYWTGISLVPVLDGTSSGHVRDLREDTLFVFRFYESDYLTIPCARLISAQERVAGSDRPVFDVTVWGKPIEIVAFESWSCVFHTPGPSVSKRAADPIRAELVLHGRLMHLGPGGAS